ncbi:hypothetical protein VTK26DRAFT_7986 [Humicola hyalothermophila]
MRLLWCSLLTFPALLSVGIAIPQTTSNVKRHASELLDSYDFIVAGGGTSGLTIADRLTEAFPNKTVLVVEYGEVEYAPGVFDPPMTVWGGQGNSASNWAFTSSPSPELNNATALVLAGRVVGGSSAVNGMFFDRASRFDFDTWDSLQGNRKQSNKRDVRWTWNDVYPFYKKSVTFTPPSEAVASKYNYTWDTSAYGDGPIHASLPPFLWGDHHVARNAWQEMGIQVTKECADGTKEGLCWIPISQHPVTARRSHAGLGHYADVIATRPNYHLLTGHQVARVVYRNGNVGFGPPVVEARSVGGTQLFNVSAKNEVILSAGVFNSPAILQRSGIGPAAFLRSARIPVVLDLPGVGSNLHDHSGPRVEWTYTKPLPYGPLPSAMLDPAYAAEAAAAFDQIPAQGPYTLAMSNSAIWVSLPNLIDSYPALLSRIRALATVDHTRSNLTTESAIASLHLPPAYALESPSSQAALVAGYRAQLRALAGLLGNERSPSLESTFATGTRASAILLHPLSRGIVRLNATHPLAPPLLDYRSASNPIDVALHVAHTRFLRRMVATPAMRRLGAVEVAPGEGVGVGGGDGDGDSDDEELVRFVRESTVQSYMHPCCTAAMMPRRKGGVVRPDLRVHGASGLRVVDASVFPMVPGSHLSATAYALAEKSRAGCLECKRRHVKCDEQRPQCIICTLSGRDCSYPPQEPPTANQAPPTPSQPQATTTSSSAQPVAGVPLPDLATQSQSPPSASQISPDVNLEHMELLIRFTFSEHAPELNIDMHEFASGLLFRCALDAPYLMHQILAVSARRQAVLQPERAGYFLDHAMHLQTKAVSIYNESAAKAQINQNNCSALLLFCSLLGRHLLADLLAKRDDDFDTFLVRFLEFLSISRGLGAMSMAAWELLLQSEIKHLVLWALDISRSAPQGRHCDELKRLVAESPDLHPLSKDACLKAIAYLQVGFDSLLGSDSRNQKYLMVFMWPPVLPQEFTDLLSRRRPEAIAVMGHWALLLHCSKELWHVGDSGSYLLGSISRYLGPGWEPWLSWPLSFVGATYKD